MGSPVVTIVTPLPPASATTPVVFTVAGGSTAPIRRAWASVAFPGIIGDEVVHNGDRFGAFYTNGANSRASITNGYQFTVLRDGGWPPGAFPVASSFTINAVDTLGNGEAPRTLYVLAGNSQLNSLGVLGGDTAARQDNVLSPILSCLLDKIYATSSAEPIPLVDMGRGDLRVANVSASPGFGPEEFFGPEIYRLLNGAAVPTASNKPWLLSFSIAGAALFQMLKASSYGTATPAFGGSNAYTALVNRIKAARNDSGREIGAFISDFGPNDGATLSDANQVAARWVQMWSDLQSDLGVGFPLILLQMDQNADAAFRPSIVRAQQALAVSNIPGSRLVVPNGLVLNSDNLHYGARPIGTIGGMFAAAVRDLRGLPPTTSPTVAFRGYGQPQFSFTTIGVVTFAPFPNPLTQNGELQLLAVGSMKTPSGTYVAIPAPTVPASGWTTLGNATQAFGTATQGFALFARPTAQADIDANNHLPPNAQILLSNDENYCKLFTIFGPPFPVTRNFTSFSRGTFSNSSQTVASINSTRPNALVVIVFMFEGGSPAIGEHFTVTNPNLVNLTVVSDEPYNLATTNYGVLTVAVGTMPAPGPIGSTTITQTNASVNFAACGFIGVVEDV